MIAACSAPGAVRATETASEVCAVLAEPGRPEAVQAAAARWGVPSHLLLAFMRQESHFKPDKRHAGTPGPYGYPQAVRGTWDQYRRETGNAGASRNNFADSMDFIGWYISATHQRTSAPYSDTVHHYLAYSRGPAAKGRPTAAALRNATKVAAFAKTYEAELKGCPLPYDEAGAGPRGPLAFLVGRD